MDARFHLLAIGSAMYPGTSPRNTLDVVARRQLLPRMRAASVTKQALMEHVDDLGRRWTVRVEPILGAKSGQLIALLGSYWRSPMAMPEPILVGSWELQMPPPGPEQRMHGWWSPSLYAAHDMAVPAGEGPHGMDAPQWLDEVVDLAAAISDALRFLTSDPQPRDWPRAPHAVRYLARHHRTRTRHLATGNHHADRRSRTRD